MSIKDSFISIKQSLGRRWAGDSAFSLNQQNPFSNYNFYQGKPTWVSLATPEAQERAARFNPIVKAAINLRASTASNGRKVAISIETGEVIPWIENDAAIKQAFKLLVQRPNPLQSSKEFESQGIYYLDVFGNRYVYANMPIGFNSEIDLLNISTLVNLPSQFVEVKTTGKFYDQVDISGIIDKFAVTNENPIRLFEPNEVIHFNEVNISKDYASIMGISKLEVLEKVIHNTELGYDAMNSLLSSLGMAGIISPHKKDGMAANVPLTPSEKFEMDKKFKADYGIQPNQNLFWISPVQMDYIKTAMSSKELGIYEDFSNNSIQIGNEYGIPPELVKTWTAGTTYENQGQSIRRLYQDTTIPLVEEQDKQWSWRLNTAKYGFEIRTTWDHIPALQDAFKEKATALNMKGRTAKDAYDNNIITWNQYLELIELPIAEKDGDMLKHERKLESTNNEEDGNEETE